MTTFPALPTNLSPSLRTAFLEGPAGIPPPGQETNFVNPPTLYNHGLVTLLVLSSVATILLFMRVYVKVFVTKTVRMSNYTMVLAWLIAHGYFVPAWKINQIGEGKDQWNLRLREFTDVLYYYFIACLIYGFTLFILKLSLLLQLLEIFSQPPQKGLLLLLLPQPHLAKLPLLHHQRLHHRLPVPPCLRCLGRPHAQWNLWDESAGCDYRGERN
ncbi:hypothetical protein BJX70DRAFT_402635 [Aspergillus crustosus]